ncbi:MAG TPA: hypothetical protein VLM83_06120, partial [Anaerolineales bacterium]|nr:hypothetical protein [Anaerolineales bacterium]
MIQISPTVIPEVIPTETPQITASPTNVVESATPGHTNLIMNCIEVTAETPAMYQSSGYLVLWGRMQARPVVIDMLTREQIALPDGWDIFDWYISPDEAWMIYEEGIIENHKVIQVNLHLMSPDGEIASTLSFDYGTIADWGWLDNERWMVFIPFDPPFNLFSLRTINPFTGELEDIPFDFPDVYRYSPIPIGFLPVSAYDPTLTRLVYAVEKLDGSVGYSLWDIANHDEILFVHAPSWYPPKWSPDGSRFIVVTYVGDSMDTATELVVIDMNGNIGHITDLSTINPHKGIGEYSWSPDGTRIAFWFSADRWQDTYEELMVLDISTGAITNYCVQGRAGWNHTNAPLWSPDSTQIVIDSDAYGSSAQVIMVDIVQGYALQLTESREALWWLKSFPNVWARP